MIVIQKESNMEIETSRYWYERISIPDSILQKIKSVVTGIKIDTLEFSGLKKDLLLVDGRVFRDVFYINRKYLYKGEFTAPSFENDYTFSKNYLTDDGLAGFSITTDGWLVSLFSNYSKGGFADAILKYVLKDAYKLVCIVADTDSDNRLVELYENLYEFRKYAKTVNDTEIMKSHYGDKFMDEFIAQNGIPFHVFMIGKNTHCLGKGGKVFNDYFEAKNYVDKTVKKVGE